MYAPGERRLIRSPAPETNQNATQCYATHCDWRLGRGDERGAEDGEGDVAGGKLAEEGAEAFGDLLGGGVGMGFVVAWPMRGWNCRPT